MQEPNSSAIPYNFTVSAHAFCNMSTCSIAPTEVSCLARALAARSHTTASSAICVAGYVLVQVDKRNAITVVRVLVSLMR